MDSIDKILEYLGKLPQLLNEYRNFSYPLLAVLLVGGLIILMVHWYRRHKSQPGLSSFLVGFGAAMIFLSAGGLFLRWAGKVADQKAMKDFIEEYRAPEDEHWLMVVDFYFPSNIDSTLRENHLSRMINLKATISEVLLEDIPSGFAQPRVVRVPREKSPWREGVGDKNFEEVISELNAFEIMWGNVINDGRLVKAFLGLPKGLASYIDNTSIIPLKDFALDENPRLELQFSEGYYRLLGLVTLGMALDTLQKAEQASGEDRKRLFLQATQQFNKAREKVNNRRNDDYLQRTVFSDTVSRLVNYSLQEAGLSP